MAVPKKKRSKARAHVRHSSFYLKNYKNIPLNFSIISFMFFLNKKLYS